MSEEKNKGGRPTLYTEELADEICDAIACSSLGVPRLCEKYAHWPEHSTVFRWLRKYPEFYNKYAGAKDFQAEVLADEIIDIVDDTTLDYRVDKDGNEVVDHEHIQRSKLRAEARKWVASRLLRKRYGDKLQAELSAKDNALFELAEMSQDERDRRALEIFNRARARAVAPTSGDGGAREEEMETTARAAN